MRRMVKFIPILIQNSCGMKNNAPLLCDTLEQTIYPCNQCSEMACACGLLPPPPEFIPMCLQPSSKVQRFFVPFIQTHTIVATAVFFFFLFLHVIYIAQSRILDFPPHTQTHMHTRQLWLANDLQLTNGICNVNGSMASMQMYAKQIRYGRKQPSIFFSPSQPSRRRELTWCLWRTPSQIDARALALEAG